MLQYEPLGLHRKFNPRELNQYSVWFHWKDLGDIREVMSEYVFTHLQQFIQLMHDAVDGHI